MPAKKISRRKTVTWFRIKLIFFIVFLTHISFFTVFLLRQLNSSGFPVENLGLKLAGVFAFIAIVIFIYLAKLRNIPAVKSITRVLRELFFILYIGFVVYLLLGIFFNPPVTITQISNLFRGHSIQYKPVGLSSMSKNVKLAVIAAEDQLFPDHNGFDVKAIKKAIVYNESHPQKQRGPSTISQQTAKNIFLWQGGGFLRKGLEVFCTYSIEALWSKKVILERYLNISEMGAGIYGVQAAARAYFGKDANELTKQEAAQIVAALPNPKKYTVKPISRYVLARSSRIVRQMNRLAGDEEIEKLGR